MGHETKNPPSHKERSHHVELGPRGWPRAGRVRGAPPPPGAPADAWGAACRNVLHTERHGGCERIGEADNGHGPPCENARARAGVRGRGLQTPVGCRRARGNKRWTATPQEATNAHVRAQTCMRARGRMRAHTHWESHMRPRACADTFGDGDCAHKHAITRSHVHTHTQTHAHVHEVRSYPTQCGDGAATRTGGVAARPPQARPTWRAQGGAAANRPPHTGRALSHATLRAQRALGRERRRACTGTTPSSGFSAESRRQSNFGRGIPTSSAAALGPSRPRILDPRPFLPTPSVVISTLSGPEGCSTDARLNPWPFWGHRRAIAKR